MKYFDTILLIIIILMGCWIIYRDYLEEKHMNEFMSDLPQIIQDANEYQTTQLPQIIRDAINDEIFVEN